jgi:hypothetical protein
VKQHKPWFDEGSSNPLHQKKQARVQWLQEPSQINEDNLNTVRREASRHFKNKKGEYLRDKINELPRHSKFKKIRYSYRGINEFKEDYQPRTNLVKGENGDLLADSHNTLKKWKLLLSAIECT